MKVFVPVIACLLVLSAPAISAEDYVLTVNGVSQEIGLGQDTNLILANGTKLKLNLSLKEYLRFTGTYFSFEHKNIYRPDRQNVDDGIFQTMVVTSLGTGVIIQEFMTIDPVSLVDLMIQEITKEEVEYGYKYSERNVEKKVGNLTLSGKQAVTTYPGEEWTRNVFAIGGKDKGVLIITMVESANMESDHDLIERMWESIQLSEELK